MTATEKKEAQEKSYRQYEIERNKLDRYKALTEKEKMERCKLLWQEMDARRKEIERK